MGAHEHEDDDDDYVSGTGGAAGEARAAAAGIIGGWAERDGRRQAPSLLPSRSLEKRAISFPFLPPKKILNGNLSLRRRGRRPP